MDRWRDPDEGTGGGPDDLVDWAEEGADEDTEDPGDDVGTI